MSRCRPLLYLHHCFSQARSQGGLEDPYNTTSKTVTENSVSRMVATRSKTRSSTGGDDQPKIDDVLEDTSTGKKRRASKGGKEGNAKDGAKNKKRKTEEGAGHGEEAKDGEDVGHAQGDVKMDDGTGNTEAPAPSGQANENKGASESKDKQAKVDDSSRVDAPAETQAIENNASSEDIKETEHTKDEEGTKKVEVAEGDTKDHAPEPAPTGATEKEEVKETEKEIVQNDNVTEYGTIHFLYKPKVRICLPSNGLSRSVFAIDSSSLATG